jgi:hypothetical protein
MSDKSPSEKDLKHYKEKSMDVIYDNIDESINAIGKFEFPYLTHVHSTEQVYRLKYLTEHLRNKCDSYLEMIEENISPLFK